MHLSLNYILSPSLCFFLSLTHSLSLSLTLPHIHPPSPFSIYLYLSVSQSLSVCLSFSPFFSFLFHLLSLSLSILSFFLLVSLSFPPSHLVSLFCKLFFSVSRATTLSGALASYWDEVTEMAFSSEKEISTVLLVFPELELFGTDYRCPTALLK